MGLVPKPRHAWTDLPPARQKAGYWVVIPNDPDSILDGCEYEIVYVYFDGKWSVRRPGQAKLEPLANFLYVEMVQPSLLEAARDGMKSAVWKPPQSCEYTRLRQQREIKAKVAGEGVYWNKRLNCQVTVTATFYPKTKLWIEEDGKKREITREELAVDHKLIEF